MSTAEQKKKRWLVVSYFTGIDKVAASIHADQRISELKARGFDVKVLTSMVVPPRKPGTTRISSLLPSGIRYESRYFFRRLRQSPVTKLFKGMTMLFLLPFYIVEKLFLPIYSSWSWYLSIVVFKKSLLKKFSPDIIYSTGGPPCTHLAASSLKEATELPWIAEYQDPVWHPSYNRNRIEKAHMIKVESTVAANADGVVFLTKRACKESQERTDYSGIVKAIYPGTSYHTDTVSEWVKRRRLRFVHIGTLSGKRSLKSILSALSTLAEKDSELHEKVEIFQYGHILPKLEKEIKSSEFSVSFMGKVAHEEALEAMQNSDVLLLIQDRDPLSGNTIPLKTYEYLQTGRPVLSLTYRNPELTDMLLSRGHWVIEVDDPEGIARILETILSRWESGSLESCCDETNLSVSSAVDQLLALAESI
jgi:hypothetical protein